MAEELNDLFERLKKRDESAFLTLYKSHKTELVAWIRSRFNLSQEASTEIFQLTMVTFFENVINHKITTLTSTLKTYLYSIGKYKALEALRKQGRMTPLESLTPLGAEPADFTPDETDDVEDEEKRYEVMGVSLKKLGAPCSDILTSFYFHRASLRELKDRLGYKSEESIKSQKFKCMERLRKIYFEQYSSQR